MYRLWGYTVIPMDFRLDAEDVASTIAFIDHFLPMLDMDDENSRDTAENVFKVRQGLWEQLGELAEHIPPGKNPVKK